MARTPVFNTQNGLRLVVASGGGLGLLGAALVECAPWLGARLAEAQAGDGQVLAVAALGIVGVPFVVELVTECLLRRASA